MVAALTATFEPAESRVRLELAGADGATAATFLRKRGATTKYDTVRGGSEVPVSGGVAQVVFDYEFPAGPTPTALAEYVVDTNAITEDFEDTSFNLTFAGTWARSSTTAASGTWSFKAAAIGHSATTDATVTVPTGATALSFNYRVSSETNFDFFRVLVDGVQVFQASGDTGWLASPSFTVVPGTTITFRYIKDPATVGFLDTAFIDNVTFTGSLRSPIASASVSIADEVWLKFPGYPYLNRTLVVTERTGINRSTRGDLIPTVNTRAPVAVQEFMSGRTYSFAIRTETWTEYTELDAALSIGGVVFLHADEAVLGLPSMYAVVDAAESAVSERAHRERRYTRVTLTEVSQPGFAYAGTLGTWQTILSNYATWQDVLDAPEFGTWALLLELEGSPSDVIVG